MNIRKIFKGALSLLMAATLVAGTSAAAFAQNDDNGADEGESVAAPVESESIATGYTVTDLLGASKSKIVKGDKVNIMVHVRNLHIKTQGLTGKITAVRPIDSFGGSGSPAVLVKSEKDDYLGFTVSFTELTYSGDGQTLSFYLTYPDSSLPKEQLSVTVKQCVEYVEPAKEESSAAPADTQAPMVIIGRGQLPGTLKPGDSCTVNVFVTNISTKTAITEGIASFETSDGLILEENSSSKQIGAILPGTSQSVPLKIKVAKSAENAAQTVSVSLKYSYKSGDGSVQQETETEKLNISVVVPPKATAAAAAAAPNIIVSSYSYGKPVAAGESFTLKLAFKNTSAKTAVENIVMSVETGASISISSSSNTYYYNSLSAGKAKGQSIDMKALANGELTAGTVTITFSYEYMSGGERQTKTSTESLNVPLFMPDRFSIAAPEMQYCSTGEECSVSLSYVNKGKGPVSNVEAQLVYGDGEVSCELPHQNLGNFEAGASGTIDFIFTPNNAGDLKVTAKITYEDEMQKQKTLEIPITVSVTEPEPIDEGGMTEEGGEAESTGVNKWLIVGISVGAVVLIAAVVIVIVKLKKKKKAKSESIPEDFNWSPEGKNDNETAEVHSDENA